MVTTASGGKRPVRPPPRDEDEHRHDDRGQGEEQRQPLKRSGEGWTWPSAIHLVREGERDQGAKGHQNAEHELRAEEEVLVTR